MPLLLEHPSEVKHVASKSCWSLFFQATDSKNIYEIHSNPMVLHIGIEHQPVYPASIIAVLGEEPILRLSTNVQTFPLTKKQL